MTAIVRYRLRLRRLAANRRGATIVEFAIVAPVMCLFLVGAFDMAHALYLRASLQGIIQKTGRDSALETATTAQQAVLDAKVTTQVLPLQNDAQLSFKRRYYRTFTDAAAAKAEVWTDTNSNGVCDQSEPYQDANANSTWDKDGGNAGQGGAKDKTVYTVTVTYKRMFPIYNWIGGDPMQTVTATTVLANQPYSDQATYGAPVVRYCPAAIDPNPTPTPTPTPSPTAPILPAPAVACPVRVFTMCIL